MSNRLQIMFWLAASFIVFSPLSVANGFAYAEASKYFRVGVMVLIVMIGIFSGDTKRMGTAGKSLLAFLGLFITSGLWSSLPLWALANKSMMAFTCVAGLMLAAALRTATDLRAALRFLGVVSCAAALVVLLVFLKNPQATVTQNRMALMGINPNMMGHAAVPLCMFCMFTALHDSRRNWRILMWGACALMLLIIIATGCRGAVLTGALGTACLLFPMSRRPSVVMGAALGIAIVAFIGLEVLNIGGAERLMREMTKNNRASIWMGAFRVIVKTPLFGIGWMHMGSRAASCLNMYLQTLVEVGIGGLLALLWALAVILMTWVEGRSRLLRLRLPTDPYYLGLSLVLIEVVHGITESDTLLGAGMATLGLGLGTGLIDCIPPLLIANARSTTGGALPARTAAIPKRRPSAREMLDAWERNGTSVPAGRSDSLTLYAASAGIPVPDAASPAESAVRDVDRAVGTKPGITPFDWRNDEHGIGPDTV